MNKNVFTSVLVVGGLLAVYFFVVKPKKLNKGKAIDLIIQKGYYTSGRSALESFDETFILSWGKAAQIGSESFTHEGKIYKTQGGKVVK
jgi:hypothetical protein